MGIMEGGQNKIVVALCLALYIIITTYIGYRNRRSKNGEDYFLASRSMPSWVLAITFIASWWGGGSAIDLIDHANVGGLSTFWIYGVPVLLATAIMFFFSAAIRRVATISQPELYEGRYDARSALLLTLFIVIFMVIAAATQIIVVGRLFESFFGISFRMGAMLGAGLVVVYSLFGGFRGVVLTDLFQFFFFLFAALYLFGVNYHDAGGFRGLAAHTSGRGMGDYFSFFHNIENNIAYIITFGTSWIIQANVWQRISAARSPRSARKMMVVSFLIFIPLYLLVTLTGMFSLVSYGAPPVGGIVSAQLLAIESPIVGALLFVGLCSAIMSTMDSMFNTGAMCLTIDIYKRYMVPFATPGRYVTVGRLSTVIVGVLATFIAMGGDSILTISWVGADFLASGAFVPLVLGFVWRRGTSTAAFYSMLFGMSFSTYNLFIVFGFDLPVAWSIASTAQSIIGMSLSFVLYVVISLSTPPDYVKADRFMSRARRS